MWEKKKHMILIPVETREPKPFYFHTDNKSITVTKGFCGILATFVKIKRHQYGHLSQQQTVTIVSRMTIINFSFHTSNSELYLPVHILKTAYIRAIAVRRKYSFSCNATFCYERVKKHIFSTKVMKMP